MSKTYNYQNLKNRIKRDFWALLAIIPYIFKKNNQNKKKAITTLIGEYPKDYIKWLKSDELLNKQRGIIQSLPNIDTYTIYFYKEHKKYMLCENTYAVEFPNSLKGMKQYFKFIYNLNPKIIQVHDSLLVGFNNLLIKTVMKTKMTFMPRGMNYYDDFIFRDKSNIIKKIKAHYNKILYIKCLKKSDFINAPAPLALECELISFKKVHTSDYLLCKGAVSVQTNDNNIINNKLKNLKRNLSSFDKKVFTFSRVEKLKIDKTIEYFLEIQNEIENSCLIIIGDGSALDYYLEKYKEYNNIIFTGWIDKNEAFSFINDFDLMIAPNGGYSLIEVGLLGIPTIAYNYNIMSDLIYNRFNGYLIDKDKPIELKKALIEYLNKSKNEQKKIKEQTKTSYYTRFNLKALEFEKNKIVRELFNDSY